LAILSAQINAAAAFDLNPAVRCPDDKHVTIAVDGHALDAAAGAARLQRADPGELLPGPDLHGAVPGAKVDEVCADHQRPRLHGRRHRADEVVVGAVPHLHAAAAVRNLKIEFMQLFSSFQLYVTLTDAPSIDGVLPVYSNPS